MAGSAEGLRAVSVVLAALYLRGSPFGQSSSNSRWMLARNALCRAAASLEQAPEALRDYGLWYEASRLETPGLIHWAETLVNAGKVLTAVDQGYPERWVQLLGGAAPPALWRLGAWSEIGPYVGVVGSRRPSAESAAFTQSAGATAAESGFTLVSGGATGVDSFAAGACLRSGGRVLEILPEGIASFLGATSLGSSIIGSKSDCSWSGTPELGEAVADLERVCRVSVCAPGEGFSTASAMERNALIYAACERAVAVQPRLKEGGTWHGAVSALRRRLTSVFIFGALGDPACEALASLGAARVESVQDFLCEGSKLQPLCRRNHGANFRQN